MRLDGSRRAIGCPGQWRLFRDGTGGGDGGLIALSRGTDVAGIPVDVLQGDLERNGAYLGRSLGQLSAAIETSRGNVT